MKLKLVKKTSRELGKIKLNLKTVNQFSNNVQRL